MPEINLNVPLSTHPTVAERFVSHADTTVSGHGKVAQRAFESAYGRLAAVDAEAAAIVGDKDLSAEAQARKVAEARAAASSAARETLSMEVERLTNAIAHTEQALVKSAAPEHATASREEIRSFVRSLSERERMVFVSKAAERGDKETVFAVLSAPTYLSGLDALRADELASLRRDALAKLDPIQGTQLAELERLREAAATALGSIR